MQILRVDDPRDALDRAGRDQLYRFALSRKVRSEEELTRIYNGANGAVLLRMILRQRGITDINVPYHQLGMPPQTVEQPSGKPAERMEDVLSEQLKEIQSQHHIAQTSIADMTFFQLRSEAKRRGIAFSRTDKMAVLREKLLGQTAT